MNGNERINRWKARAGAGAAVAAMAAVVVAVIAFGLAGPARAGDGVRGINLPSMGKQYLTEPSGEPGRGINLPSMGKQYLVEPGGGRSASGPPPAKAHVMRPMPVRPIRPGPQQRPQRPAPQGPAPMAPWKLTAPVTPGPGPATAPGAPDDWPGAWPSGGKVPGLEDDPFGDQSGPFGGPSNPFGGASDPFEDQSGPLGGLTGPFGRPLNPFGDRTGPSGGQSGPLGGPSNPFGDPSSPFGDESGPFGGSGPGAGNGPFGGPGPLAPGKGAEPFGGGSDRPLGDWYYVEGGPRWVKITEHHKGMAEMEDFEDATRQDYGGGSLDAPPRERSDPYPPAEEYYEREREEGEFLKAQEEFLKEKQRMEELQQQKEQDENGNDGDDDHDNDDGDGTEDCEGPDDPGGGRPDPNEIDPNSVIFPGELITDPADPQDSGSAPWGSPPAGWHFTKDPGQASNPGPEGAEGGGRPIKGGVRFKGVLITDPPEPEG